MEFLSGLMPHIPADGSVANILVWVVALNALLSGLSVALEKVKDKTKTDLDNKAYDAIHKVADFLKKAVDFASANIEHK